MGAGTVEARMLNLCHVLATRTMKSSRRARSNSRVAFVASYHAFCGILRMIRCQHNAWVHAFATFAVLFAAFFFSISRPDWCWIILAISMVWTAEALNTAFEFLADAASPEFHPLVRNAKDVTAGAVLITAIAAVIIGCVVFWPYVEFCFVALIT